MKKVLAIILSLLMLVGCSRSDSVVSASFTNLDNVDKQYNVLTSSDFNISDFDRDFINYISIEKENDNYVVSPLSLNYALGLLLDGANEEMKQELLNVLGKDDIDDVYFSASSFYGFLADLYGDLSEEEKKEMPCIINVANSIWQNKDISNDFKDSYIASVKKHYNAVAKQASAYKMASLVNDWIDENTNGLIKKLLDENKTVEHNALLINTLYLKDDWCSEFDENTSKREFTCFDGSVVDKEYLTNTSTYKFYQDESTMLTIIPLMGNLKMAVVVGEKDNLDDKISLAETMDVKLAIPQFEIETSLDNKEIVSFLQDKGANKCFDSGVSGFTEMIDGQSLYVDDIIQKAKIKVNNQGVEAAAVTAIMMKEGCFFSEQYVIANYDKPFSFYIYVTVNDISHILFAGQYGK